MSTPPQNLVEVKIKAKYGVGSDSTPPRIAWVIFSPSSLAAAIQRNLIHFYFNLVRIKLKIYIPLFFSFETHGSKILVEDLQQASWKA